MYLPRIAIAGVVAVVLAASGCRCPSAGCLPATPHIACDLAEAAVEDAAPDLVALTPDCVAGACSLQPLPGPDETYQLLTPAECQCRAAANANLANLVELEEHWASVVIECDSQVVQENLCLQRDLLELHAADLRNKAAGAALEAYYQLAGLEARKHYLELAIQETARSSERAAKLRDAGLPVEIDREEIAIRLSELEDQRLQLDYARVQLNGQLQKQLGCPVSENRFFWPQVDWAPDMSALDPEAELAAGLPQRFDLRGLELVLCNLEKTTLRVARGVLAVADGTLGSVEPTEGIVHRLRCLNCNEHEVAVRCRQLARLYQDTEQLATAEIKGAVYQVIMQQQRVALARNAVEARRANVESLTARRDAEDIPVFEISAARGRLYDAESDLIEQVATLKVAMVRLRQAQAALAAECGFAPTLCCEGSCNGACVRCKAGVCCYGDSACRCDKCCRE
ncbi:MAG TPA: TolC family protein [Lacipirellula sp.]